MYEAAATLTVTPNTSEDMQKNSLAPNTWSLFFSTKDLTPNTEARSAAKKPKIYHL